MVFCRNFGKNNKKRENEIFYLSIKILFGIIRDENN